MYKRSRNRTGKAMEVARLFCDPRCFHLQEVDERLGLPKGKSSQLLKYARRLEMLTVRTELPMPIDTEIGTSLERRFPPTRIMAVDTSSSLLPAAPRSMGQHEEDDFLHEALGVAAAQYLGGRLRHYDLVGTGAGRAIFHTARALQAFPGSHETSRGITVFGLHGQVDRRVWRPTGRYALQSVDAVRVTHTLANALPSAIALPLMLPLVQHAPEDVRAAMAAPASHLTRREWVQRPPSMALVGIGVMGGPPAIKGRSRRTLSAMPGMARSIKKQLMSLKEICREFYGRFRYIPISDVCERLFWVPEDDEAPELKKRALPLIRQIAECVLSVETGLEPEGEGLSGKHRPGSLDQIQEVVVVAGGKHKVRALARLLKHRREAEGRRFMDTLITDLKTANSLLRL